MPVSVDLHPNQQLPTFIYGTAWKEERTESLTTQALQAGFRAIDTANQRRHYHEAGVGAGLQAAYDEGITQRNELFLQTKFTYINGQDHRLPYSPDAGYATQVEQSFESSLAHLQTDYLDSYVLHGPLYREGFNQEDREVWSAMERLHQAGRVQFLGVSNVNPEQLAQLCDHARVKPAFVQNRCYARLGWDRAVREVCAQNDIIYQGFSLLTANPEVFLEPRFNLICDRVERTPAQVIFRFCHQIGILPLTGTTNPERMRLDLRTNDFELTPAQVETIETISNFPIFHENI